MARRTNTTSACIAQKLEQRGSPTFTLAVGRTARLAFWAFAIFAPVMNVW